MRVPAPKYLPKFLSEILGSFSISRKTLQLHSVFREGQILGIWRDNPIPHAPGTFEILWGIPFLLFGQYVVWGRFFGDAWLKRRTYYALTDRRVLILQEGWKRKFQLSFLESIPEISREGDDTGTLWLGTKVPLWGSAALLSATRVVFTWGVEFPRSRTSQTSTLSAT